MSSVSQRDRSRFTGATPSRAEPARRRAALRGGAVASALLVASLPLTAEAALPDGRVEFSMYGRMGVAWGLNTPQIIQGQTMNLGGHSIGGRLEEGDYLEPVIRAHIVKPVSKDETYIDMVFTPAMYARSGSFVASAANNAPAGTLQIELAQSYIEAGNVFVPGLSFWGGARYYRGEDLHIADYFYFNNLTGQGGGVKYKALDLAVLVHSATQGNPLYNIDVNGDGTADVQRMRTMFVGQYTHKFGPYTSYIRGLAELHTLPAARQGSDLIAPGDYGWVLGAKLHLDFDKGNFNDISVRYGTRIANGATDGAQTFTTFGNPTLPELGKNPRQIYGTYDGGAGVELVDHFLVNFGHIATLNGYGTLHYDKGANVDKANNRAIDFAMGARSLIYAHKNFQMVNELTFQGRKIDDLDMGTAVKFSVVPTLVPSGELTAWARPHLRMIYTAGFYNQAAVDQKMSPYLKNVTLSPVAHYLGARAEWWF
jgi:maltoporin